jgi:hypothetical protein
MSSEYDEIDALLGKESLSSDLEDAEIAELDAILGSINDDGFLSEREEVFLANKNYLQNNTASTVDKKLMELQEKLMDEVEDILEEYSGGCMSGEHMGLDEEYDLIDEVEFGLDEELGLDDEFGYEPVGDEDIFGYNPFAAITGAAQDFFQPGRKRRQNRRSRRRTRRKGIIDIYQDTFIDPMASTVRSTTRALTGQSRKRQDKRRARRQVRRSRRMVRRGRRQSEATIATRRKYMRLVKNLKSACLKFRKLQTTRITNKNFRAVAPGAMAIKPFSIASATYVSSFPVVASTVSSSLSKRESRVLSRKLKRREAQILKAAKACDEKYDRLIAVWRKLSRTGNTVGLKSPREVVSQGFGWMKKAIKNADRKVKLSQREKGLVRRNRLLEKRRMKALREERKQLALIQKQRRAAIALRRKKMAEFEKQRAIELKKREKLKKQLAIEGRKEAKSEYDDLLAQTSYIDEADLKALERAATARKVEALAPIPTAPTLPPIPALPVPVRRRRTVRRRPVARIVQRQPIIPRRRRTVIVSLAEERAIRKKIIKNLKAGSIQPYGRINKHPQESQTEFEAFHRQSQKLLKKNIEKHNKKKQKEFSARQKKRQQLLKKQQKSQARIQRRVAQPRVSVAQPKPRVVAPQSRVAQPTKNALGKRLAVLQKRKANTEKQLEKAVQLHKKALDAKKRAENSKAPKVVVQNHYKAVVKHASDSSKFRSKLAKINKEISLIKG